MGHTVSSQRQVADRVMEEMRAYGKSLMGDDRAAFQRLLAKGVKHFGNISYTSSYNTWAFVLLSMMVEQEKELMRRDEGVSD
jgi:hypothetical protein